MFSEMLKSIQGEDPQDSRFSATRRAQRFDGRLSAGSTPPRRRPPGSEVRSCNSTVGAAAEQQHTISARIAVAATDGLEQHYGAGWSALVGQCTLLQLVPVIAQRAAHHVLQEISFEASAAVCMNNTKMCIYLLQGKAQQAKSHSQCGTRSSIPCAAGKLVCTMDQWPWYCACTREWSPRGGSIRMG
jgi:hypothetical protein